MSLCGATVQAPCLSAILAQSAQTMKLPDLQGALTRDMPSAISATNIEVKSWQNEQQSIPKPKRELYAKFTDGQKVEIAKRVAEHGIASTICHFAKKYPDLKESSVHTCKNAFCNTVPHVLEDMIAVHHHLHTKPFACHVHTFLPRSAPSKPSGLK